ncbi:hypothetical protein R3P38DRAFT_2806278 [Favolaschia claudopus]|uniref:Uncharacterized protein n=1 Tax=Favolaschia claudopus TaxID=2862362 RepID=A0AAV9ZBC3_9AGAR
MDFVVSKRIPAERTPRVGAEWKLSMISLWRLGIGLHDIEHATAGAVLVTFIAARLYNVLDIHLILEIFNDVVENVGETKAAMKEPEIKSACCRLHELHVSVTQFELREKMCCHILQKIRPQTDVFWLQIARGRLYKSPEQGNKALVVVLPISIEACPAHERSALNMGDKEDPLGQNYHANITFRQVTPQYTLNRILSSENID